MVLIKKYVRYIFELGGTRQVLSLRKYVNTSIKNTYISNYPSRPVNGMRIRGWFRDGRELAHTFFEEVAL